MRFPQATSARSGKGIIVALLLLACSVGLTAFVSAGSGARGAAQMAGKIEATIFSYDGQDFTRTTTTLMTADGKSAGGTKLERDTPAFKALAMKHSYTGDVMVFGKKYAASYAPLTDKDGKVTGALFVGVSK